MNPLRRSYEARVLVVPLGSNGLDLVKELEARGVEGVRILTDHDPGSALTRPVGQCAWQPPDSAGTSEIAEAADMVVLVGTDLTQVSEPDVQQVCGAARRGGDLIAAVLVAPARWEQPAGASAMVTLRQEVDMLVSVRGPNLLAALLDVLRGGTRTPEKRAADTALAEVST